MIPVNYVLVFLVAVVFGTAIWSHWRLLRQTKELDGRLQNTIAAVMAGKKEDRPEEAPKTDPEQAEAVEQTVLLRAAVVQLEKMNAQVAEFITGQRRVMRAIDGSAGTPDDELWEMARVLRERYPDLTLEDCLARARTQKTYSGGR